MGDAFARRSLVKYLDCTPGRALAVLPGPARNCSALGWFRQAAMQEQIRHLFETGVRSQIFNGVPGDCQPAGLAIDVAEPSRCGDDIFQSVRSCFRSFEESLLHCQY